MIVQVAAAPNILATNTSKAAKDTSAMISIARYAARIVNPSDEESVKIQGLKSPSPIPAHFDSSSYEVSKSCKDKSF